MSHEGIRITTAEQAARQSEADAPRLTGDAIRFKWNDGHEAGLYSWDYLRNVCDTAVRGL